MSSGKVSLGLLIGGLRLGGVCECLVQGGGNRSAVPLGWTPGGASGPGSKEKKSALEALGLYVGLDLSGTPGKAECGRQLAERLSVAWGPDCHSTGDSITLIGLNRLIDGAIAQITDPVEQQRIVNAFAIMAPAPRSEQIDAENQPVPDTSELQHDIAERVALLSGPTETPMGVPPLGQRIGVEDVRFDNGDWRGRVAQIQGWLHLPQELNLSAPDMFDRKLGRRARTASRSLRGRQRRGQTGRDPRTAGRTS